MAAPAAELQKAIFSALAADAALVAALGGAHIYDQPPKKAAFPHLTFGRTSVYDWSTGTELDTEQLLEIIRAKLADSLMPLDDREPVRIKPEFFEQRYDEDLAVHHGLLRFRAIAEAPASA
jgi:hypothetical protein